MFQQMKYYIAVVDEHNFSRAAADCNISQSAISQQIKELENTVGVTLLKRKGRSFEVTPAGHYFYQHAQKIVQETEQLVQNTQQMVKQDQEAYTLNVGYLIDFGTKEFLQAIAQFSQQFPQAHINMKGGMHEELFTLLRNGKIDLDLADQRRALSNEYENLLLTGTDFLAVVAKNFTDQKEVTVDELADLPCILVMNDSNQKMQEQEEAYYRDVLGIKSSFRIVTTFDEAQVLVATGQGFLIVNDRTKINVDQNVNQTLPIKNGSHQLHQRYYAYWKKDNSGYYIEAFADILKKQFTD
jgi:DNA-binding transcriptional LysR family regulator